MSSDERLQCEHCEESFRLPYTLVLHLMREHPDKVEPVDPVMATVMGGAVLHYER